MKIVAVVIFFSALSSLLTWIFIRDSYDAGYELIGSIGNASAVELNTRILQLEDEADARCHLSKHTQRMVEDLRRIEIPDQYIIGGPGLPAVTKAVVDDAIARYGNTEISEFASSCKTKGSLF